MCDYIFGFYISKNIADDRRDIAKRYVMASVIINLCILGFFKYTDFFINNLRMIPALSFLQPLGLSLPIGISFYTFQTMSYTIDIYRGDAKVQKNITSFGAYVAAWPQLVAGPIVRYRTISEELQNRKENVPEIAEGLRRFTAGLMKKVFIANNMAAVADTIFAYAPEKAGALGMWLAVAAYTLQIYFDFSGYSDMAIGLGRMLGFHYLENFDYPYISKSVTEFWRRWHISLGTFFRDYLYIPLGGNRVSVPRWVLNILIVWFLTGLWHGAEWTFIIWGVYFGALLLIEKLFLQNNLLKIPVVRNIYTIAAFVFGWIIFRAESVPHIGQILSTMFGAHGKGSMLDLASSGAVKPIYLIAGVTGIICSVPISRKIKEFLSSRGKLVYLIDAASVLAVIYCLAMLAQGAYNPFIYFRF
jgi:alginate O-acetyltransferase complex protein AlgI